MNIIVTIKCFYNLFEVNLKERENREQNKKLKQQQK